MNKYDQDFIRSPEGDALYAKWIRIKNISCRPWADDFMEFANWALDSGYELHATIRRKNKKEQYSPKNCCWVVNGNVKREQTKKYDYKIYKDSTFRVEWNRAVNRIRKHYGLEPFEIDEPDYSDRTCKDCIHYNVCKYKAKGIPICEDYLD